MNTSRKMNVVGYVYILTFQALGSERHSACTYIGWAKDVEARLAEHRAGVGAAITRAAVEKGYALEVFAVLPGLTRNDERALKNRKNARKIMEQLRKGTLKIGEATFSL